MYFERRHAQFSRRELSGKRNDRVAIALGDETRNRNNLTVTDSGHGETPSGRSKTHVVARERFGRV